MAEYHGSCSTEVDYSSKTILFVGDMWVGKSSFIQNYCDHVRNYYKCLSLEGAVITFIQHVLFREESGNRVRYTLMNNPYPEPIREDLFENVSADLVVLCFAVDDAKSLERVCGRLPDYRQQFPLARFHLLGLQQDERPGLLKEMKSAINFEDNHYPVSAKRAEHCHQQLGLCGEYLECSVKEEPQQARHCMEKLMADARTPTS